MKRILLVFLAAACAHAQPYEAPSGFDLSGTFSATTAASTLFKDKSADAGFRAVLYPTLKLSRHWIAAGAWQVVSRPYYYSDFVTQGHGLTGRVMQGYLGYTQVWKSASVMVRAGELSSAFGSFPLHYDDRDNALIDIPMQYGYYGGAATLSALAGVEVDGTWKKLDGRAQFVNSSPAHPRSVFDNEQYGNWAGGAGVTLRQGLRFGASAYRGPYLDRHSPFYRPFEGPPRSIPATGTGIDGQWGYGHWNVRGELQRFLMTYGPAPAFHEHTGYIEVQRELGARWYVASRFGYLDADFSGLVESIEAVAGYRPGAGQIVKLSYENLHRENTGQQDRTLALQFVTTFHPLAFAHR